MSNYDLRLDLPALAYINAQVLSFLESGGTAWDAKKQVFSSQPYVTSGLDPYTYKLWNHAQLLSLLYCCLVVPREFLDLPQTHSIYKDFDDMDIRALFVNIQPPNIDSYVLLRCLRNSVAHALFSISHPSGEWQYEFWTDRAPVFRAQIGQKNLTDFMSKVGLSLVNAVLAKKPKSDATAGS